MDPRDWSWFLASALRTCAPEFRRGGQCANHGHENALRSRSKGVSGHRSRVGALLRRFSAGAFVRVLRVREVDDRAKDAEKDDCPDDEAGECGLSIGAKCVVVGIVSHDTS